MPAITIPNTFTAGGLIKSAEINSNFSEVATKFNSYAVRTDSAPTMAADFLFTDALYDIGKSGATRPRDGFFSRNVTISGIGTFIQQYGPNAIVTATDAATVAFDLNSGNVQRVTLGGNRTITLSNPREGGRYIIALYQDGTGSRTVTWPTIRWSGGSAPTLTTTASKVDLISLIRLNSEWFGSVATNA